MAQKYYEIRTTPQYPATSIGSDLARHMEVRQYLGSAIIVCHDPISTISVVRKAWLNLARNLQKQRASTLNAEEILRLTHAIIHMQNMEFVPKPPQETTEANVYFVKPSQLKFLPQSCYTVYLLHPVKAKELAFALGGLANSGLVVNYDIGISMSKLGLMPKSKLETQVMNEWSNVVSMLHRLKIDPKQLLNSHPTSLAANDHALDLLLGVPQEFLHVTSSFQHTLHLAQPLSTISAEYQRQFSAVARLAHRIQTLTPTTFSNYLIRNFGSHNDYEIFFLHDQNTKEINKQQLAYLTLKTPDKRGDAQRGSSQICFIFI